MAWMEGNSLYKGLEVAQVSSHFPETDFSVITQLDVAFGEVSVFTNVLPRIEFQNFLFAVWDPSAIQMPEFAFYDFLPKSIFFGHISTAIWFVKPNFFSSYHLLPNLHNFGGLTFSRQLGGCDPYCLPPPQRKSLIILSERKYKGMLVSIEFTRVNLPPLEMRKPY